MTTTAELDELIEELTVDVYNDDEQLSGFLVCADAARVRGEQATIAGAAVEVLGVDCGPELRTGLTARVLREGSSTRSRLPTWSSRRVARSRSWSPPTGAGTDDRRPRAQF
jgi:hypothetical protein